MKFDLSKFKKIREDRNSALLMHPEGHKIEIAKSALDRRMLEQLKRLPAHEQTDLATLGQPMAEGGEATAANQSANAKENTGKGKKKPLREFKDVVGEEVRPTEEEMRQVDPPMRSTGVIQLAEGGADDAQTHQAEINNDWMDAEMGDKRGERAGIGGPVGRPRNQNWETMRAAKGGQVRMAEGGDPARDPAMMLNDQPTGSPASIFGGGPSGGVDLPPAAGSPAATPAPQVPAANPFTNVVPPAPAAAIGVNPGGGAIKTAYDQYIGGISKSIKGSEEGIAQEAAATGHLGAMQAQAEADHQGLMLKIKDEHENQYNALNGEIGNAIQDLKNGDIDPNHYMNSKSTPGKISTAIGLVLGGMGSGLTGQPNMALQFLNAQIDRDVVAQRANLGKKGTVLEGFLKQMGNLNDATKMTWAFYNDLYMGEMRKQAALSQDPMAKATAQRLISDRELQKAQLLGPIAMQRALLSTMQSPDTNPAAAVRMYGQLGLISPQQSTEGMKEIGKAQQIEELRSDMLDSYNHLHGQFMNGALSPNDTESATKAFAGAIQHISEGRFNQEAAMNIAESLLPGKTDSEQTVANKLPRLHKFFDAFRQEPTLDSIGIKIHQQPRSLAKPNQKTLSGYGGR